MTFAFDVQTPTGDQKFEIEPGQSLVFVGANGSGKTRLAVFIEDTLKERAHRISAHRALSLNPTVAKISEDQALRGLRTGHVSTNIENRSGNRWGRKGAVSLLNDYDFLVQALFAEQSNTALTSHRNARSKSGAEPDATKFEKLEEIWNRILPDRKLMISGDDIRAAATKDGDAKYPASDMSDGERAVFYLIGQTLAAATDTILIFDEPELHIHRAIMSRLWDELEAARPDCAFVLITHDLEFASSRRGQKFVVRDYSREGGWLIESVPEDTGFDEATTTLILGSRKPILFVEGAGSSLDRAVYRACYPDWTVVPRGSCEEVIHAVITMRANAQLTRVTCSGIVDADAYSQEEVTYLQSKGIEVLPVSEIENLLLLPTVAEAIAAGEGYKGAELGSKLAKIFDELFAEAAKNREDVVVRYCKRRIDRALRMVDLSQATTVADVEAAYRSATASLDIPAIAALARGEIDKAVNAKDAGLLLRWYDNKGMLAIAAKLKDTKLGAFEQWIVRALRNKSAPDVAAAIAKVLPGLIAA